MKKYTTIFLLICAFNSFAQNNTNSILVRHDTVMLKADECEWIIRSLVKNEPALTPEMGKPLPLIILEAIEKGKLKAIDPETNNPIPAKEIFTWNLPPDTAIMNDVNGNGEQGFHIIQRLHSPHSFNGIKIYQDWYFDVSTGKFHAIIKWIELREDILNSQGTFLGTAALCRIYY